MPDKYENRNDHAGIGKTEDAGLLYTGQTTPITPYTFTSNFLFLKAHDPVFFQLASAAEQYFRLDPNTTMVKLRQLTEAMAKVSLHDSVFLHTLIKIKMNYCIRSTVRSIWIRE